MENIIWDPAWNIGHAEIDKQHQKWVEIFNRLRNAVLSESDEKPDEIQRTTLKEMLEYTHYHFDSEEKLMKETNYSEAHGHWRLHKEFDKTVYEKYRGLEGNALILNSDLLSLMKNWLLGHIQTEDQKFGQYLSSLSI
jgi:hemerythrin